MPVTADMEAPREPASGDFSDALTFAFGDFEAEVYGVARLGLSTGAGGEVQASGLAIVFDGHEARAVRAAGGIDLGRRDWTAIDAAGLTTTTQAPLSEWTVSFESEDSAVTFDLRFESTAAPYAIPERSDVAKAGGMQGYEQLCRVTGAAEIAGETRKIDCLGQRGHTWGAPDWEKITLARTISAWMGEDLGVVLTAVRPVKASTHADEALGAGIISAEGSLEVAEPRLSTTYDSGGRQRRASLELWDDDEDGFARRLGGDVVCGTSLDLGHLRLDCAFFRWQMEGRQGIGRYDILRRVG
jgi:hypothetical protein